jgi:segregation and condensation protein A
MEGLIEGFSFENLLADSGYDSDRFEPPSQMRTRRPSNRSRSRAIPYDKVLVFIEKARTLRLEVAADYLVMAAWLAYLKSRLVLPAWEHKHDPSETDSMADALRLRLQRLEAIQKAAADLGKRPRLGVNVFVRGMTEDIKVDGDERIGNLTLEDLVKGGELELRQDSLFGPISLRLRSTALDD